jgi:hypothetical protein
MVPETIGKFGPDMTWKRALKKRVPVVAKLVPPI